MKNLKNYLLERNSFEEHSVVADEIMWGIINKYKDIQPKLEDFIHEMEAEGWEYDEKYSDNKELYFAGSFLDGDDEIFVKVAYKKHGNKIEILGHEFES